MSKYVVSFTPKCGESRLAQIAKNWPRVKFECYVCGEETETYEGCLTVPPDPSTVKRREDIEPVATCLNQRCKDFEQKRQDALFAHIMQPQLQDYLIRRQEEMRWKRGKKKEDGSSDGKK